MAVGFSRIARSAAQLCRSGVRSTLARQFSFKGGQYTTKDKVSMLMFDRENKAAIFNHATGGNVIKWYVRGITAFTLLSMYLAWAEFQDPIYGKMNHIGFFIGSFVGLFALTCFNIYSRRVVHQIHIFKSGDRVRVQFFNAFWRPKVKEYLVSEFNTPTLSFANFTKVEITSLGNVWVLEERNIYAGDGGVWRDAVYAKDPEIPVLVKKVLRGQTIDFGLSQSLLR